MMPPSQQAEVKGTGKNGKEEEDCCIDHKTSNTGVALVCDIDGVLLHGSSLIPGADTAIQRLIDGETGEFRIPVVFLTNGGNYTEGIRSASLSEKLGVKVSPYQVVLSHSPAKKACQKESLKLLIASDEEIAASVAESYDWKNYTLVQRYAKAHPHLYPHKYQEHIDSDPNLQATYDHEEPVEEIIVLSTPRDWGEAIQICYDLVTSSNGKLGKRHRRRPSDHQTVRVYVANPDMVYGDRFDCPRFTTGAWLHCLQTLLEHDHYQLDVTLFGKPYAGTYEYTHELLSRIAAEHGIDEIHRIYAVGDNPLSDIKGANQAGEKWHSILVRTGVWKGEADNDSQNPAKTVAQDFQAAVDVILQSIE